MRIAIDIQAVAETRTGVGRYTLHLAEALPGVVPGDRYTLFLFDFRRRFREPALGATGARVLRIPLPGRVVRKAWDRLDWPPLERLTGFSFDLFHFPNYLVPPLSGTPALATIHDVGFLRHPEHADPRFLRGLDRNLERSLGRATGLTTVSEFSRAEIAEVLGVPASRIHVVPPGVAPVFAGPCDERIVREVRRGTGLPGPYLLTVGTVEPRKNLPLLLEAFAARLPFFRGKECRLVVAGKRGWRCEGVFETVRTLRLEDDVCFTGYVEDPVLAALYRGAEFAVFPSLYEGFGIPPLEAMAARLPVLASDIEAHREVLGDAALYFDPRDPAALGRRMVELYEARELRRSLMEKGLERARLFTWEAAAARMARVYRRLVEGKGAAGARGSGAGEDPDGRSGRVETDGGRRTG